MIFLDEKNSCYKMSVPQRKRSYCSSQTLPINLCEGWRWKRIKNILKSMWRKKQSPTANRRMSKKNIAGSCFTRYQNAL